LVGRIGNPPVNFAAGIKVNEVWDGLYNPKSLRSFPGSRQTHEKNGLGLGIFLLHFPSSLG